MIARGRLFLSKTAPLATVAADGTFVLTMLAFDRIGAHQVEPWRITYSGLDAQHWWKCHQADLIAGTPLYVELDRIRTFSTPRGPEFQSSVVLILHEPLLSMQPDRQPESAQTA